MLNHALAHWSSGMTTALGVLYAFLACATLWAYFTHRSTDLKQKIVAWWWFLPAITLSLVFASQAGWLLLVAMLSFGMSELTAQAQTALGRTKSLLLTAGLVLVVALVGLVWWMPWLALVLLALDVFLIWYLFNADRHTAWVPLMALVPLATGLGFLPKIQDTFQDDGEWLLWLCAVTALADVGQFIMGRIFGKSLISPRASPGKTRAGVIGGFAVALVTGLSLGHLMHLASWYVLASLAAAIAVAGFFGDITLSACKRMLSIKDFSNRVPGHGGLLDRVDSLTLTAPAVFIGLRFLPT